MKLKIFNNHWFIVRYSRIKEEMRIILLNIVIAIITISCKEKPNYNPFDEQFDVSVNSLISDKCDTISAGCGYFNLIKNEGKLKPYYQVHIEEFDQVVAKGFSYVLDTFRVANYKDKCTNETKLDSIKMLPLDRYALNKELGKYGYQISTRINSSIQIVNFELSDTINLELYLNSILGSRNWVRGIEYYKENVNCEY